MKASFKRLIFSLSFFMFLFLKIKFVYANDLYLLYEKSETAEISKGVTYQKIRQVTSLGLRDIYTMTVPLNDPNIKINNTSSIKDFNLKETVSELLNSKQAIAGINGDFFAMSGYYSSAQGPTIQEGKLVSIDILNNLYKNEYASFLLSDENNPIIDYVKTSISFLNNGYENIHVHYINKVPEMTYPVYIDSKAMTNTAPVDAIFNNVTKIIVKDRKVVKISNPGETVEVPQNGYVILIGEQSYELASYVKVGQDTEIKINTNIDLSKIYTSIGGGGKILVNGQVAADGGFVPSGRHPRSAIGVSKDGNNLVLTVVDGRSHSIGASHYEMASIMLRLGAYNAMHLDGGGSSTMVIKEPENDKGFVVNKPSDGTERKVVNALGIYTNAESGELSKIKISLTSDKIINELGTPYKVVGLDDYLNQVPIDLNKVVLSSEDGTFKNQMFYPNKIGKINVSAKYNDLVGESSVQSIKLIEINPILNSINTKVGEKTYLEFTGKSIEGITRYIYDGLNFEVFPNDLGKIEENNFVALKDGTGYIKVNVLDAVAYLDVSVGTQEISISSFEEYQNIYYSSYPENIIGSAFQEYLNPINGDISIVLRSNFDSISTSQYAFINFKDKLYLKDNPISLTISAFGDDSKNIIRGSIVDSLGKSFSLNFSDSIDWTGYKDLRVSIPNQVTYPIYLENIYVLKTNNINTGEKTYYFDNLRGEIPMISNVEHPKNSVFHDILRADLNQLLFDTSFEITAVGDLSNNKINKPEFYTNFQANIINLFSVNSSLGLLAGDSDYEGTINIPYYAWGRYYGFYTFNNLGIAFMTNKNGSFFSSNFDQWTNLFNDIKAKNKKHIIIETDFDPLKSKSYKETELFHESLNELYEDGLNIFVISTEGTKTYTTLKDGIRYINLGGLFNTDDTINKDFRVLRFKISDDKIFYDLQKVN